MAVAASAAVPPRDPAPLAPASAGQQPAIQPSAAPVATAARVTPAPAGASGPAAAPSARQATDSPALSPRLFAHPKRRAAYEVGGWRQVAALARVEVSHYFTAASGLRTGDVDFRPFVAGARVIAGEVLGRIGVTDPLQATHVSFQIRPGGKGSPLIDPKPILDGWKLLGSTAINRRANLSPGFGRTMADPTIGQIFLESRAQLEQQVLTNPSIDIYACGRTDIQAGLVDQRVLATLEFLAVAGLKPGVSALRCGVSLAGTAFDLSGAVSDNALGDGVDISSIDEVPVLGHQGAGSITDIAIRRLLTLQATFKPQQIVSLMSYPSAENTVAAADHGDRIHIGFTTLFAPGGTLGQPAVSVLSPDQWTRYVARLGQIVNPVVASEPSISAIPVVPAK